MVGFRFAAAAAVAVGMPAFAEDAVKEIPPATWVLRRLVCPLLVFCVFRASVRLGRSTRRTKMGGLLEKFADVNRGFRMLKPSTWNQFEGEVGAYDFRWVDVVSPVDMITISTSSYGGGSISEIADVAKLGGKLSSSRGSILASRARESDGILFYDYEFLSLIHI